MNALKKMGIPATAEGGTIRTEIPAYRSDIIHQIDLVEDIAIGHGYERISPRLPQSMTMGELRDVEKFCMKLRRILAGYGFHEVTTLTLSNEREQFGMMELEPAERATIANPLTEELTSARVSLLPWSSRYLQRTSIMTFRRECLRWAMS